MHLNCFLLLSVRSLWLSFAPWTIKPLFGLLLKRSGLLFVEDLPVICGLHFYMSFSICIERVQPPLGIFGFFLLILGDLQTTTTTTPITTKPHTCPIEHIIYVVLCTEMILMFLLPILAIKIAKMLQEITYKAYNTIHRRPDDAFRGLRILQMPAMMLLLARCPPSRRSSYRHQLIHL